MGRYWGVAPPVRPRKAVSRVVSRVTFRGDEPSNSPTPPPTACRAVGNSSVDTATHLYGNPCYAARPMVSTDRCYLTGSANRR